MQKRNGLPLRVRVLDAEHQNEFLGRLTCVTCGVMVPRGAGRPYCMEHSAYVQRLLVEVRAHEVLVARAKTNHKVKPKKRAA